MYTIIRKVNKIQGTYNLKLISILNIYNFGYYICFSLLNTISNNFILVQIFT